MATLDMRLEQDTYMLGEFTGHSILLMRNALFPWFLIVPHCREIELYKLDMTQQQQLLALSSRISQFIENNFNIDKINVATIGNVVAQLHLHVIGRRRDDACWPGVVWGTDQFAAYENNQVEQITNKLSRFLGDAFIVNTELSE